MENFKEIFAWIIKQINKLRKVQPAVFYITFFILTVITGGIFLYIFLLAWLGLEIYKFSYYKSDDFQELKNRLETYVSECNSLNNHIEELKSTFSTPRKINMGMATVETGGKYNFQKQEYRKAKKSDNIYECSASVLKNAELQPYKYFSKYFNIAMDEESLQMFENMLNNFSAAEEGKTLLTEELNDIKRATESDVPFLIKVFSMDKFMQKVGFTKVDFSTLYFPSYYFRYVSPGGNKSETLRILFNIENLNGFVVYLSEKIKFKKSAAGQRALMTTKLRTKIKDRDNYTCKSCSLSVYDEPHLLLEIDHILPISRGGLTEENNLQTLCWKCNRTKGSNVI